MTRDLYLVLGLDRDASAEEIKRAYKSLAKEFHPDACFVPGDDTHEPDSSRFREIAEAYRVLSDPGLKADYDRSLGQKARKHAHRPSLRWRERSLSKSKAFERPSRRSDLHLQVILSPTEARLGTQLPLSIPVTAECDRCKGRGCAFCNWHGYVKSSVALRLRIASGVKGGEIVSVMLDDVRLPGVRLVIHLGIDYNFRL